jgi:hypothetical protein
MAETVTSVFGGHTTLGARSVDQYGGLELSPIARHHHIGLTAAVELADALTQRLSARGDFLVYDTPGI